MAIRDVHLYSISKKAKKKGSQVQIPQLVKSSDNVTVAEVSAINTELKNSCKEKKKYQTDLPSKVKDEVVKYAHRYQTQVAVAHFCGKYQQDTIKRTTVNNWKRKFYNPQEEVGEPPEKFNKKGRPSLVGEELLVKIKEAIIGIRLTRAVISRNSLNSLSEFGGGITLTDNWAKGVLKSMDYVK